MTPAREVALRPRQDTDLARVCSILRRVHEHDGYPASFPSDPVDWLTRDRNRACFVAVCRLACGEEPALVGHVSRAVAEGDEAETVWTSALGVAASELAVVKRLFVDPGARGRGIGRLLLGEVVADAHRLGLHPVLDVDVTSTGANSLYLAAGWTPVGDVQLGWTGLDAYPFTARCYVGPPPPRAERRHAL